MGLSIIKAYINNANISEGAEFVVYGKQHNDPARIDPPWNDEYTYQLSDTEISELAEEYYKNILLDNTDTLVTAIEDFINDKHNFIKYCKDILCKTNADEEVFNYAIKNNNFEYLYGMDIPQQLIDLVAEYMAEDEFYIESYIEDNEDKLQQLAQEKFDNEQE